MILVVFVYISTLYCKRFHSHLCRQLISKCEKTKEVGATKVIQPNRKGCFSYFVVRDISYSNDVGEILVK